MTAHSRIEGGGARWRLGRRLVGCIGTCSINDKQKETKKSKGDERKGDSFYDKQKIDPEQEMKETLAKYAQKLWSYGVQRMQFQPRTLRTVRS